MAKISAASVRRRQAIQSQKTVGIGYNGKKNCPEARRPGLTALKSKFAPLVIAERDLPSLDEGVTVGNTLYDRKYLEGKTARCITLIVPSRAGLNHSHRIDYVGRAARILWINVVIGRN